MKRLILESVVGGAVITALTVAGVFYVAWALSMSQPIDWNGVLTTAMLFGPLVGLCGAIEIGTYPR